LVSIAVAEWAARGDGVYPKHSNFFQMLFMQSNKNVSDEKLYLPVSPVAPPKRTQVDLLIYVTVWPKRAGGF